MAITLQAIEFSYKKATWVGNKMQEYIDNGASLGWLIDRTTRQVYIYTPDSQIKCLDNPETVSGEPILAGFVLSLAKIW